jgi:hypothetical protein
MPPIRQVTAALALVCLFTFFAVIWSFSSDPTPAKPGTVSPPHRPTGTPYGKGPLAATWKQWFYPGSWNEGRLDAQRGGKVGPDWNIYYHLGGNGPWIPKVDGVLSNDTAPPQGCVVQQVHMVCKLLRN